ncbi:hypothetical protein BGX27_008480 [Mortierella sp. AM989]|nr:hypothetical protein BGX27_008480 [Mortierella sp. AM989]
MQLKTIATALVVAGLAAAQNNTNTTAFDHGVAHIKTDKIDATFTFHEAADGMNITVAVASGLTTGYQILDVGFEYHVHDFPVGPNNNCTATGAHLDPAKVGVAKPCDPQNLTSCQTGDLSGKHGNLVAVNNETGSIPTFSYLDSHLSFKGPANETLLGRSIVIHNNGTRIGCADLVVAGYTAPAANGTDPAGKPSADKPSGAAKLVGSLALSGIVTLMMMAL